MSSTFVRAIARAVIVVAALATVPLAGASPAFASASGLVQITRTPTVPPNSTLTLNIACPTGTMPLSGGFQLFVTALDTVMAIENRPSGAFWRMSIVNDHVASVLPTLIVTCGAVTNYTVVAEDVTIPSQGTASVSVNCPSGLVNVGGGYRDPDTDPSAVSVRTNRPFTSGQGWVYSVYNAGSTSMTGTGYAVCGTVSGRVIRDTSLQVAPEQQGFFSANCPSGRVATAGGWVTNSNDGWSVYEAFANGTSAFSTAVKNRSATNTYTMTARVICVPAS